MASQTPPHGEMVALDSCIAALAESVKACSIAETKDLETEQAPQRTSSYVPLTDVEFVTLQVEVEQKMQKKRARGRKDVNEFKTFPLGVEKGIYGDVLAYSLDWMEHDLGLHHRQVQPQHIDAELEDLIVDFGLHLDKASEMGRSFPNLELKSFFLVRHRVLVHQSILVAMLNGLYQLKHRKETLSHLHRDTILIEKTIEMVDLHLKRKYPD